MVLKNRIRIPMKFKYFHSQQYHALVPHLLKGGGDGHGGGSGGKSGGGERSSFGAGASRFLYSRNNQNLITCAILLGHCQAGAFPSKLMEHFSGTFHLFPSTHFRFLQYCDSFSWPWNEMESRIGNYGQSTDIHRY